MILVNAEVEAQSHGLCVISFASFELQSEGKRSKNSFVFLKTASKMIANTDKKLERFVWFSPSGGKEIGDCIPAAVIGEPGADGLVQIRVIDEDEVFLVEESEMRVIHPLSLQGVPDILFLDDFSEESLMYTLRKRFQEHKIYTYVGPILISLNPYE